MIRAAPVSIVLLAACGGATPKTSTSDAPADAAVATSIGTNAAACPSSLTFALVGTSCAVNDVCRYPEGSCSCITQWPCSGAEPSPAEVALFPMAWECAATDPTILRVDGCPAMQAPEGTCATEDKVCRYGGDCGGSWTVATCRDGRWQRESGYSSPPP